MLKKILIGIGVLVILAGSGYGYLYYRNYSLSPRGEATLNNGGLDVSIKYCRPSVRERLIFGKEEDAALQPYGKYWRLGANEATEITFNKDVLFVDQEVKSGTYRMYAVPGENYFEIKLNSELGKWGAFEPDYTLDVTKVLLGTMPSEHTEQFTIKLEPLYDNSVKVIFSWSDVTFSLPIIAN